MTWQDRNDLFFQFGGQSSQEVRACGDGGMSGRCVSERYRTG